MLFCPDFIGLHHHFPDKFSLGSEKTQKNVGGNQHYLGEIPRFLLEI
jgi:hypothetical protein